MEEVIQKYGSRRAGFTAFSDGWKSHGFFPRQQNSLNKASEGRQACFPLNNSGPLKSFWQCLASFFFFF